VRRALIATAGTAAAVAALLSYKSSNAIKTSGVAVRLKSPTSATTAPATTIAPGPGTTVAPGPGTTVAPGPGTTVGTTGGSPTTTTPVRGPRRYTGIDVPYNYGELQLQVAIDNQKITAITVIRNLGTDERSRSINTQAVPILIQEALDAQGINIDVVSGATFTSDAFAQALQSALEQAGR